MLVRNYASQG